MRNGTNAPLPPGYVMYKREDGRNVTPQERQVVVTQLLELLEAQTATTLLDVGCGAGQLTRELLPHFESVTGVDLSEEMVERARTALPGVALQAAPAHDLPFADGSFSRALCYSVFQDLPDFAYARQAVREILRVVAPGGIAVLADVQDAARRHISFEERNRRKASPIALAWRGLRNMVTDAALGPRPYGFYPMSFFEELAAADGHLCQIVPGTPVLEWSAWRNHVIFHKRE